MAKIYNSYEDYSIIGAGRAPVIAPKVYAPPTNSGYATIAELNSKVLELKNMIANLPTTTGVDNTAEIAAINTTLAALQSSIDTLTTTVKPTLSVKITLPAPTLVLFETMIYAVGLGVYVCVSNKEVPTLDSDCFWVQL